MKAKKKQCKLEGQEAFTLVELLIVCMLMVLVLAAIASMIQSGARTSSSAYSSVKVEEAGGEALDTMIRQMRGAEALSSASTANLLIFAVDLDGDGAREEVRFEVSGNTLQKGSIAWDSRPATPADWIAGCDQLNLTYWKTNDNTKELIEVVPGSSAWTNGDYLKITRIDMQLHMFRKAGDNPDVQRTVTGSVDLRNTLQDLF